MRRALVLQTAVVTALMTAAPGAQPPQIDRPTRAWAKAILGDVKSAIQDLYYDPTFRGIDLTARFKAAEAQIETAQSINHALGIIAQAALDLGDSHTFFIPPAHADAVDYGWRMQMIGDRCFVTFVRPGSDAETKGLGVGDEILRIDPFVPSRGELWKLQYLYSVLSPRTSITLVVRSPGAEPRTVQAQAAIRKGQRVVDLTQMDPREAFDAIWGRPRAAYGVTRVGNVTVWKLSTFGFPPADADKVVDEAVTGTTRLVLDLRGNGGGLVKTLEQVAGRLFDHAVTLSQAKGRSGTVASVAKPRKTPFTGPLVVLIDSRTGSAAEVLARTVQLERRGTVIGDRSSGSVMQSQRRRFSRGMTSVVFYGASVTVADLVMADGKSLEGVGVLPDEVVLPSPEDLAANRDPALVRAVEILRR